MNYAVQIKKFSEGFYKNDMSEKRIPAVRGRQQGS
jgi:hypothetical protein